MRSAVHSRRRQRGLTLLESLLALTVVAVGVLGSASLLAQAFAQQRQAAAQSLANNLLAEGAELLQLAAALPPATVVAALAQWQARVSTELPPDGGGAATASVTPLPLPDGSAAQLLQINNATLSLLAVTTAWPPGAP